MLRHIFSLVLGCWWVSLANGSASNGCSRPQSPKTATSPNRTLVVHDPQLGPVVRRYRLFVPGGETPQGGMPLLLGFHGQGGDPWQWSGWHSFDDLANKHRWIVAYPAGMDDGNDSGWNCGTAADNSTCLPGTNGASCHTSCKKLGKCGPCNWSTCYDDVAFIDQLVSSLQDEFCLNTSAHFLVGESNGGMLTHHLIQELPGKFRGAATAFALPLLGYLVGSKFQLVTQAAEASRTSIFAVYPRSDITIPYTGGSDGDSHGWLYENRDKTIGVWAALHGCDMTPTYRKSPYEGGSTRIQCFEYVGCKSGRVSYCMYDGVHGDWPDQPGADNMIWSFFGSLLDAPKSTPGAISGSIRLEGTVV